MNYNSKSLSRYISNVRTDRLVSCFMPTSMAITANYHGSITTNYNNQFRQLVDLLNTERLELASTVQKNLQQCHDYIGSRNSGVRLAWKYEKADLELGGTGSCNWTEEQRDQILKNGNVTGAEGHHQKNVADHPEHQANPDNIKFYKSREEHLKEGHKGDFRNETDSDFIDKNGILQKTNYKRVIKNELFGLGISAVIGFGITFTITAIVEVATTGIDSVEFIDVFSHSFNAGLIGGAISAGCYCLGRLVSNFLQAKGIAILSNSLLHHAFAGGVTILLLSVVQFIKMKFEGVETTEVFKQVGKQVVQSGTSLALYILAIGFFGKTIGLVVSVGIGIMFIAYNIYDIYHQRKINEHITEFIIERHKPVISG